MTTSPHISVLLEEVVAALAPRDGDVLLDGTFGAGGYSKALLAAADCTVLAIDRDPLAVGWGRDLSGSFGGRLRMIEGRYGDMAELATAEGFGQLNGVTLDIGVSSMQIDQAERGFSFAKDGPLDMRMEQAGLSAADVVNGMDETELANIIYRYGEERLSRRVAHAIVEARRIKRFERTRELAELLRRVVPKSKDGIDPATRTFQALRIYVNDELGELERGLEAAERLLAPGGRLAVVTFHSLEDRVVKSFLRDRSGGGARPSRHLPSVGDEAPATFTIPVRKAIEAGETERQRNPRARSARLRVGLRTDVPVSAAHRAENPVRGESS